MYDTAATCTLQWIKNDLVNFHIRAKFNLGSENKSNENENRMRTKINELEHQIGRAETRMKRTNVDC